MEGKRKNSQCSTQTSASSFCSRLRSLPGQDTKPKQGEPRGRFPTPIWSSEPFLLPRRRMTLGSRKSWNGKSNSAPFGPFHQKRPPCAAGEPCPANGPMDLGFRERDFFEKAAHEGRLFFFLFDDSRGLVTHPIFFRETGQSEQGISDRGAPS